MELNRKIVIKRVVQTRNTSASYENIPFCPKSNWVRIKRNANRHMRSLRYLKNIQHEWRLAYKKLSLSHRTVLVWVLNWTHLRYFGLLNLLLNTVEFNWMTVHLTIRHHWAHKKPQLWKIVCVAWLKNMSKTTHDHESHMTLIHWKPHRIIYWKKTHLSNANEM